MNTISAVILIAIVTASATATAAETTLLIRDVAVVNIETGTIAAGQSVLIRDGLIADVSPQIAPDDSVRVYEGEGAFLIPGLWDSHAHAAARSARCLGWPRLPAGRDDKRCARLGRCHHRA